MDINDLKRKIRAQRLFNVAVDGINVEMLIPSDFDSKIQAVKSGLGDRKPEAMMIFSRALLESAIVGWSGVTVGYLTGENDQDAVDFDKQLVKEFLDADRTKTDIFSSKLLEKVFEKRGLADEAKKN